MVGTMDARIGRRETLMDKTNHHKPGWAYLVIFNDLAMCGCGQYDDRLDILKEVLNACPLYETEKTPDYLRTPLGEWFLCLLDKAKLIEHGSSIGGSWLTDKGTRLRDDLNDEDIWKEFQNDTAGICECSDCEPKETN